MDGTTEGELCVVDEAGCEVDGCKMSEGETDVRRTKGDADVVRWKKDSVWDSESPDGDVPDGCAERPGVMSSLVLMLEMDGSDELELAEPERGAVAASVGGERGRGVCCAKVTKLIESGLTGSTDGGGRSPASPIRSSLSIRLASTVSLGLPRRSAMLLTFSGGEVIVVRAKGRQSSTLCRRGRGVSDQTWGALAAGTCATRGQE